MTARNASVVGDPDNDEQLQKLLGCLLLPNAEDAKAETDKGARLLRKAALFLAMALEKVLCLSDEMLEESAARNKGLRQMCAPKPPSIDENLAKLRRAIDEPSVFGVGGMQDKVATKREEASSDVGPDPLVANDPWAQPPAAVTPKTKRPRTAWKGSASQENKADWSDYQQRGWQNNPWQANKWANCEWHQSHRDTWQQSQSDGELGDLAEPEKSLANDEAASAPVLSSQSAVSPPGLGIQQPVALSKRSGWQRFPWEADVPTNQSTLEMPALCPEASLTESPGDTEAPAVSEEQLPKGSVAALVEHFEETASAEEKTARQVAQTEAVGDKPVLSESGSLVCRTQKLLLTALEANSAAASQQESLEADDMLDQVCEIAEQRLQEAKSRDVAKRTLRQTDVQEVAPKANFPKPSKQQRRAAKAARK